MPSGPLATISLSEYGVIITHLEVLAVMTRNKIRLRLSYMGFIEHTTFIVVHTYIQ